MKQKAGRARGQMSEAMITVLFLSLSGGLQDAYSYLSRGHVFANAQTGNIVLLSANIFSGSWAAAMHYLIPVLSFALGVLASELIRFRFQHRSSVHWRQLVLLGEIALLFAVGFFPAALDMAANALVSFACAMQVQAFRKVGGHPFASTMCIGNLRSGVEALCAFVRTKNPNNLPRAARYFGVIFAFFLGAGLGSRLVPVLGHGTIWLSCALLLCSLLLMIPGERKEK